MKNEKTAAARPTVGFPVERMVRLPSHDPKTAAWLERRMGWQIVSKVARARWVGGVMIRCGTMPAMIALRNWCIDLLSAARGAILLPVDATDPNTSSIVPTKPRTFRK